MILTSAQIKFIRSLKDKKARDEAGLFVVEGEKMVSEAIESTFDVVEVYRCDEIGQAAMERITLLSSPSPALALVRKPSTLNEKLEFRDGGLYLALDSIRDPGNMGTIIRTADWFGADAVIASPDSVDIFNPKVIQSTMGALFRVDFHCLDLPETLKDIQGSRIFGTFLEGNDIYEYDLSSGGPRIIVTGNESNGISKEVASLCTDRITIPSYAHGRGSESLNAAVATAITVSEFRRR